MLLAPCKPPILCVSLLAGGAQGTLYPSPWPLAGLSGWLARRRAGTSRGKEEQLLICRKLLSAPQGSDPLLVQPPPAPTLSSFTHSSSCLLLKTWSLD